MKQFKDISNSTVDALIAEWVKSDRDRRVLHRRLIDGVRFETLAEEFDLSVRQVKTIVYRQGEKMLKHLPI